MGTKPFNKDEAIAGKPMTFKGKRDAKVLDTFDRGGVPWFWIYIEGDFSPWTYSLDEASRAFSMKTETVVRWVNVYGGECRAHGGDQAYCLGDLHCTEEQADGLAKMQEYPRIGRAHKIVIEE